jgi:hypothetical protein
MSKPQKLQNGIYITIARSSAGLSYEAIFNNHLVGDYFASKNKRRNYGRNYAKGVSTRVYTNFKEWIADLRFIENSYLKSYYGA